MSTQIDSPLEKSKGLVLKLELCTGWGGELINDRKECRRTFSLVSSQARLVLIRGHSLFVGTIIAVPQIRRVPLEAIIDQSDNVSYDLLLGLAISCAFPITATANEQFDEFEERMTYNDSDNECVSLSTIEELEDVIEQYAQEDVGALCLKIALRRKRSTPHKSLEKCKILEAAASPSVSVLASSPEPDDYLSYLSYLEENELTTLNDVAGLDIEDCIQEAKRLVNLYNQLMVHASQCHAASTCLVKGCAKMKTCLQHAGTCQVKLSGGCQNCKQMLPRVHATMCREAVCPFSQCAEIQERMQGRQEPKLSLLNLHLP